jgi:hypothetical protein
MFALNALNLRQNSFVRVVKGAALAATLVFAAASAQAAQTPFSSLSGTWSGPGTITLNTGVKEQIRCRATYDVNGSATNLNLVLRCASASYKFELQSRVAYAGGTVSGSWNEATRGVGGTITGSANGTRINARVEGIFSALLSLNTNGGSQSISISSPGSELQSVAISLAKGK